MSLEPEIETKLENFIRSSNFKEAGAVITDLDGTAVHEYQGRTRIAREVELGLIAHYQSGRPIVLNSLRFPLSVIRTFGREWYKLSGGPIPTITLNGSLCGYMLKNAESELSFEETAAFPLTNEEINETLEGVQGLLTGGIKSLLLFYYPRDWRIGEVIWTPVPDNVEHVKEKYSSASAVTAVKFEKLQSQMLAEEICMIFLLIDVGEDQLMAYQHTQRNNFITHKAVDKLFGTAAMAKELHIDLRNTMGAGDTQLDNFLAGVGLALLVGSKDLEFRGTMDTVKIKDSSELGDFLFRAAELCK